MWEMKARADGAPAGAWSRDLKCNTATVHGCVAFQTACEKLVPFTVSSFLQFRLVAPMGHTRLFTFYKRVSLKPPMTSAIVPMARAGR